MTKFTTHTMESAPEASKPLLDNSIKAFGMVPNLHAVLASSPAALKVYQVQHEAFLNSSFDADELTVVWQTINVEHECGYCVPAHTAIAHSMKVSEEIINALRNKTPLPTEKLEALRDTTLSILRNRGRLDGEELARFFAAGYGEQQVLEIILGLSQKVISNYTNHIAETELDAPFKQFA
ncbi:carboxymuconolactone decarboxylase family protein [Thalassotalea euphylliae]|uniref:Carboxymuconolactone decarboxylase family protein n=1 Tax=Thalassotalea euphylliae TaxID=1655234 RepID=A0A3E0TVE6_9GAMM|nr:carboxymuconolactone decarboxylase family protein [Thalassotalea euphylliae]REL28641.1 carboxymuconolactone decarboxylase family protein [Thalassotalea euphylliae]